MNFLDACKAMKKGKRVRRETWIPSPVDNGDGEVCLMDDHRIVFEHPSGSRRNFALFEQDYLADDWRVIPEPMTFMQAVEAMKAGKKVRRRNGFEKAIIHFDPKTDMFFDEHSHVGFYMSDIDATDWEVAE